MPEWRKRLERELRGLAVPPERLDELLEELSQDLEERYRSARSGGADAEQAAARAWAGLGSAEDLRQRLGELEAWPAGERFARERPAGSGDGSALLGGLGQDLRHALRSLRRSPGFTAVALATLALGIGANTTLFGIVNALFLAPLPGAEPERLVAVYTSDYSGPRFGTSSYPDLEELRDQPGLFESLAAYSFEAVALRTGAEPARVWAEFVTGDYFATLGLAMARGRALGPDDDAPSAPPAAVISHGLWQRRLAGDPAVLGRTLALSGETFTVVGVAPEGFTGMTRGVAAEAWLPLALRGRLVPGGDALRRRGARLLHLVGRLAPEASHQDVQARLDVVAERLRAAYPDEWTDRAGETRRLTLVAEREARLGPEARGPLGALSAVLATVVALVLLIACANVASLMLARATARSREVAVRQTLGAGRGRLVRLFLAESLAVAAGGGALGLALAWWASAALRALSLPLPVPVHLPVVVDLRVLAFALALTVATGVVVGLVPALHAANPDLLPALRDEGGGVAGGPRGRRLRRAFVVAQVALSMVLLVGASLLLRGFARAASLAPGFEVEQTRLVPVDLGLAGYDVAQTTALIEALAERTPGVPGARAAALTLTLPVELHVARRSTLAEGYVPRPGEEREVWFGVVGPGHFEALGIPILRGRAFTPADRADAPAVAVVNESFAARFWPGRDPIGLTLRMRGEDGPPVAVVGLAKDSKYRSLAEDPMPFYYLPIAQDFGFVERFARLFPLHVVVRGGGDLAATGRAVAAALREIDPDLPVYPSKPMAEHLGVSALPSRVASLVFTAFGALGLFLASLGLYGVVAYAMARRTREIGVRMALGASRRDVLELGIRDGLTLALAGVGLGALLAAALGQGLRSLLFGLSPLDPVSFLLVPLLLALVALAASAIPAGRAARVDPVEALRHE